MIYVFIGVLAYLASVAIGYSGIRAMCKSRGLDADGSLVIAVFIPVMNVIFGVAGFFESGAANKFFRL